ncbi:McrB family protein [Gordonia humi]|uniref:McrB family protein n=1 Tax=Gordonia humi TaxID=686429 RepID=UPI00361E2F2B
MLQGAPGTGKTWLARRLAYALIGSRLDDAVRSVQFHPGTSYEDFVRGWRPGGDGRLTLVDGPLLQHAARARTAPDIPHVIVIEEFNRGNPAQALGEMLTLLERSKRTAADALELTYMRDDELAFFLPDNLYVVGTMNTADRSLALVDFALRRRFAFFELEPQFTDAWAAELAGRFRSDAPTRIDGLRTRIVAMNQRIADDPSLGPSFRIGHAYFTPGLEAPRSRDLVHLGRRIIGPTSARRILARRSGDGRRRRRRPHVGPLRCTEPGRVRRGSTSAASGSSSCTRRTISTGSLIERRRSRCCAVSGTTTSSTRSPRRSPATSTRGSGR